MTLVCQNNRYHIALLISFTFSQGYLQNHTILIFFFFFSRFYAIEDLNMTVTETFLYELNKY